MSNLACKILLCLGGNKAENETLSKINDNMKLTKKKKKEIIAASEEISKIQKEIILSINEPIVKQ